MLLLSRAAGFAQGLRPGHSLVAEASRCISASAPSQNVLNHDISSEWYNRQRQLIMLGNRLPTKAPDAWLAPNAVVVGDVDLYDKVSVWYGAVLRGDLNNITVGSNSTIFDRVVIHAARTSPSGLSAATVLGKNVIVEPSSVLRSCRVGDNCIIGAKSSLMEGSMMESNSILAPGSVLPPARRVPEGELWAGNPAKFVRKLTKDEISEIAELADKAREVGYVHWTEKLPFGTAWRQAEEFRAAAVKSGDYLEVDHRSERYYQRVTAEKEAAEKLAE